MLHCPLCQSKSISKFATATDLEYFTTKETFDYLQCGACEFVFLQNPPVDRLAEIYPDTYYSGDSEFNKSILHKIKDGLEVRLFKRILGRLKGEELAVLDVGGGYGFILNNIKKADPRVTHTSVVDLNPSFRAKAEAKGHRYYCTPIERLETEERFDFICALNLIEHVSDPRAVLAKLRNLLKPGGQLLIKTPNINTLDRALFQHRNWAGFHCPRHFVLFTKENFSDLAKAEGLLVNTAKFTQGASQWAASFLAWLHKKRMISLGPELPVCRHPFFNPVMAVAAVFDYLRMPFSKTAQMFFVLEAPKAPN